MSKRRSKRGIDNNSGGIRESLQHQLQLVCNPDPRIASAATALQNESANCSSYCLSTKQIFSASIQKCCRKRLIKNLWTAVQKPPPESEFAAANNNKIRYFQQQIAQHQNQHQQYSTPPTAATILQAKCLPRVSPSTSNTQRGSPTRMASLLQQQQQYSTRITHPDGVSPLAAAILNADCSHASSINTTDCNKSGGNGGIDNNNNSGAAQSLS